MAAGVMLVMTGGASSYPIRYVVEDNNRLFLPGQSDRFVGDLNVYLRCTNDRPRDTGEKCERYRKEGAVKGLVVPNLRSGAPLDEYKVRYDKVTHQHPDGYALERQRRISLSIDGKWRGPNSAEPQRCRWTVADRAGLVAIANESCESAPHDVTLTLSSNGERLSWEGRVEVVIEHEGGVSPPFFIDAVVRDVLIVAMGDSFTSGEGNPERNHSQDLPAQWLDYRCHRSVYSYPVMVAAALALADPRHSVTLIHVACSGAETTEGVLQPYEGAISREQASALWRERTAPGEWKRYGTVKPEMPPQIEQVERLLKTHTADGLPRRPELLLMSIGVNDMGMVDLLETLAKPCSAGCLDRLRKMRTTNSADCSNRSDRRRRSFDCLAKLLSEARAAIDTRLAPQKTYLMEYINPLRDETGKICGDSASHRQLLRGMLGSFGSLMNWAGILHLSATEIRYADEEFNRPLKDKLKSTAARLPWRYIEAQGKENMRGFCARPSWYHRYEESLVRQHLNPKSWKDSVGTLHPNAFGQYFVAVRVLSRLRRDQAPVGHNLAQMDQADFSPTSQQPRNDGYRGFAWHIWNRHDEPDIARYHRF